MFLRIGLFLATNLAIILVLSVVSQVFGLQTFTAQYGINWGGMLVMCAIIGFMGSFISLALSKWIAKRSVGARVIDAPQTSQEAWLVENVRQLASSAGIGMPEVALYSSPDANAFATGMNKNNALVAVSTGLLQNMTQEQVRAVLAHEVSHIANGDMVTLALIQGVVNTFVMFAARVVGSVVDKAVLGNRDGPGIGYFVSVIVFELLFGVLASMIVMWFSRRREFRADAGAARLSGASGMIGALEALRRIHEPAQTPKQMEVFAISGRSSRWGRLFMSHPPLEERIRALQAVAA